MALSPEEKRAKLARLLREKARRPRQAPPSFSQERMWFLEQWNPGSALFNMPVVVRLTGELHLEALERGLQQLVDRHEALRTTLTVEEGLPVQCIAPGLELPLEVVDLQEHPEGARESVAWERVSAEARRPFELERGPLLRTVLLRLAAREHLLLVNTHHIVTDAWSLGVLVRELAALYGAFAEGRPSPLAPLPLQYADYAAWQREWLRGPVLEEQLSWWCSRLDPTARLELPADKPRPAVLGSRGERQVLMLSPELTAALKALGQREGKTLFVVLLAAFKALLHRYTGQLDLVVGSLLAGRNRADLEGLIGLFINALALRTRLTGDTPFRELLAAVHETTLQAYARQDVPFEKLVEALKVERSSSHLPLFQVMLVLQNAPLPPLEARGLVMDALPVDTKTTKHDLTLYAIELPQGLRLSAEYSTDLFEAPTMARLLGHLRTLLAGAVEDPDQRLAALPLLTAPEREQILREWRGARADYPRDACLHTLIEAQVRRTPDAVALSFEGTQLTYAELDARANQLAWHLRSLGVGPEVRVGLCLERSLEMVVSLLATLKAGGAYVPLDPAYPPQRLTGMLEDARPAVLLAQERLLPRLPPHEARVVCVDTRWDEVAVHPRRAPPSTVDARGLAYVIFTSGSTGRPKGAMNEHGPVVNRLLWMQEAYGLTAADTVLQKTPFSFDVSVWEFFWPLMVGARLVVARPGGHQEPAYLARLIAEEGVTTLHFVPSMLQVFLEEPGLERCASLRRVVCSGEALPVDLAERCLKRLPGAGLHNLYGPTEAAVDVTFHACVPGETRRSVPIGRPVANTHILLLDERLQPVPVGVSGELFIGGVQVGRGYLGRPELTAERFIPDPFSDTPGARMYRTGDVARWLPDGAVEYLGRADFQVKVRGLRIELGEIEAVLEQHPAVRQAVVVARADGGGEKRLVAYVAGRGDAGTVDVDALRALMQAKLPEYMVPSALMVLEALPLSPNGKVDRKALPAPEVERAREGHVAPATPTEVEVAALFGQLLGVEGVGAKDDLFKLGGNSLLATRVLARLRARFGVELPLRALFQHSSVQQVARLVDEALARAAPVVERAPETERRHRLPVIPLRADALPPGLDTPPLVEGEVPLTEAERHQLLVEWNDTAADFPREMCLHQLVEAQARATPDAMAVVAGSVRLTYAELEARANRLAWRLRELGVGPEVRVGLCVERTADMVVGMLGILKAGGAYVPLDPTYPQERLAFLLEDAQGPALVAHSHLLSALPPHSATAVCLDTDSDALALLPATPVAAPPLPENVAYLIYTSGSTGRPKGVAIPHRSAVAFLTWAHGVFSAEELRGVLACTSLNFDLSVFEVFAPLSRGGTVIVARHALELAELPHASDVTLVNTVPSAMAQLLRLGALPASVRTVNLAGEPLPAPLAREVYEVPTVRRLYNLYGPSEDTTYSTFSLVKPGEPPHIGRPISNTRAYVLDEHLHPVRVGLPGELYLAGQGLARGYLHRPELTAERFLPDPFGPPGARMYRTGDRVRYRADGVLEYLGRNDFQVKVRGFRIELGEVEARLQQLPGVREAVVVAREDGPGGQRLVGYVAGQGLDADTLRDGLRAVLPAYMVPSAFVVLEALPRNSNGKVDRKALPVPAAERSSLRPYEAPRTPTEELLAGLWRQVLGVERVGAKDHFFELGGHSLLATQVVARLRTALRAEVLLQAFFEAPTLEALALRVEAARGDGAALPVVPPLLPVPRTQAALPVSFAQQRLWLLDRLEPGGTAYIILAALRLQGPLDVRALVRAFEALVARHESLRTVFGEDEQGPTQVILPAGPPDMALVDLRELPESEREAEARALASAEARRPFLLEKGPLVRALLLRLEERHHLLVVSMHHIISDGWSSGVLIRELTALYEAFSRSEEPRLPPLPVQYADYAVWQRQWLKGDVLESQLGWWKEQLAGAPAHLELPTDKPRPEVLSPRGGRVPVRLGESVSSALKGLCQRSGVTPFMALLAGFVALLSHETGQQDVLVGSPIAGRGLPELEGLIGFFVNTLALRTKLGGNPSFRELLGRVREGTLGAYAHQDVPFERLVEALQPERSPGRSPLFQVMFVLQNAPFAQPMGPGLSMRFEDVERHSAKFDLTLALWETEEGFSGSLEYASDLFEPSTATRLAERLRGLLAWAVAHPEAPLSQLDLAPPVRERLVPFQFGGSRPPFFCVHAVGGTVSGYAELVRHLGTEQPFIGMQARGLEGEQPPLESIEEMAALYVEALREVQPHGPYRLGGWSLGAVIAFEMARVLSEAGEVVEQLVLIEPSPTSYAQGTHVEESATLDGLFALNLARTLGLPVEPEDVERQDDTPALLRHLLEKGRRAGVFGPEVGLARLQALQRVFTSCARALHQHVLRPLPLPVVLLRGRDAEVGEAHVPDRGWAALASHVEVVEVSGDHYSVLQSPHVETLASALSRVLDVPSEQAPHGPKGMPPRLGVSVLSTKRTSR